MNTFLTDQIAKGEHVDNTSNCTTEARLGGVIGWRCWIGALLNSIQEAVTGTIAVSGPLTDAQLRATAVPVSLPADTAAVLTSTAAVANGTVTAGAKSVTFLPASDFVGTIDGIAYTGAEFQVVPFGAPEKKTLPAIAYTRSAGTLNIHKLV